MADLSGRRRARTPLMLTRATTRLRGRPRLADNARAPQMMAAMLAEYEASKAANRARLVAYIAWWDRWVEGSVNR